MGAFVLQVIILLMSLCNLLNAAISCYGNDKQAVDWFIVYKLPVYYTKKLNAKYTFPPHLYMDSRNPNFQFLTQSLNETSQAVAYTLQQAYTNRQSQDVGYIFYNDEKPLAAGGGVTEKYGHTKGVTIFDESTALWLIHSVPKFPPPTNTSYSYPDTGVYYGQHMMCVSVSTATDVSNIGLQLTYNQPWVYDYQIPPQLGDKYPTMLNVITGVQHSHDSNVELIHSSVQQTVFIVFAKSPSFNQDLYSAMVAPSLQCNLLTETWQNGPKSGNLPSACNQTYKVETVLSIANKQLNISYSNHVDHSKLAVCSDSGYICVGDINRQSHQLVRGGGTVCFFDLGVQKQYMSLIQSIDTCKQYRSNE